MLKPRVTHENVFWEGRQITKKPLKLGIFYKYDKEQGCRCKNDFRLKIINPTPLAVDLAKLYSLIDGLPIPSAISFASQPSAGDKEPVPPRNSTAGGASKKTRTIAASAVSFFLRLRCLSVECEKTG